MKKKIIIPIIIGVAILAIGCILYFNLEQDYSHLDIEDYRDNYTLCSQGGKNSDWLPTRAQALRVTPGMSQEERIKIIGLPQEFKGSGMITDEYHLRDGGRMWISFGGVILFSTTPFQKYDDFIEEYEQHSRNVSGVIGEGELENIIDFLNTSDGKAPDHYYEYDVNFHLKQPYEDAYAASLSKIRNDGSVLLPVVACEYYRFMPQEQNGDTCIMVSSSDGFTVETFIANDILNGGVTKYLGKRYNIGIKSANVSIIEGKEYYFLNNDLLFENVKSYRHTVYFKIDDEHYCAVGTNNTKQELVEFVKTLEFKEHFLKG